MCVDIGDLNNVLALLERHNCIKTNYYMLGRHLNLSYKTLSVIEQEHKGQVDRCFTECLAHWLRKADSVVEDPTLETLQNALREIGENAVADGINKERICGKRVIVTVLLYLDDKDSIALRSAESLTTPSTSTLQGSYKSLLVHCIMFSIFIDHPQQPVVNPGISFNLTLFGIQCTHTCMMVTIEL